MDRFIEIGLPLKQINKYIHDASTESISSNNTKTDSESTISTIVIDGDAKASKDSGKLNCDDTDSNKTSNSEIISDSSTIEEFKCTENRHENLAEEIQKDPLKITIEFSNIFQILHTLCQNHNGVEIEYLRVESICRFILYYLR